MSYEKPNPLALKRPERTIQNLELTDSSQPGLVVKIKLRALDALDATNANALAQELIGTYIQSGIPFPAIDGEVLKLNENIINGISMLYYSQCGNEEEKFTPEELLAFSVTAPEIWEAIGTAAEKLISTSIWGKTLGIVSVPAELS